MPTVLSRRAGARSRRHRTALECDRSVPPRSTRTQSTGKFAVRSLCVHLLLDRQSSSLARVRAWEDDLVDLPSAQMIDPELAGRVVALPTVSDLLNEAPRSKFHRRAVIVSGVGFFTDAYDLFVISTVAALVTVQWHLSTTQTSWVTGSAILAAFVGAVVFGRVADVIGRKKVYALVAAIMIVGAIISAAAPDYICLVAGRFVLGLGIGGRLPRFRRAHERVFKSGRPRSPRGLGVFHAGTRSHRWPIGWTRAARQRSRT
jgi:hypothetical protein